MAKILQCKKAFCLAFLSVLSINIFPKTYDIKTDIDGLTCHMHTLSKNKMQTLIGNFQAFFTSVGQSNTSGVTHGGGYSSTNIPFINNQGLSAWSIGSQSHSSSTEHKVKIDPFHDAVKEYMAVRVTIKNTSDKTISLPDDYLDGKIGDVAFTDCYVPKEELRQLVYPLFYKDVTSKYWSGLLLSIISGIFVVPCGVLAAVTPLAAGCNEDSCIFTAVCGLTAIAAGLGTYFGYRMAKNANELYYDAENREKNIMHSTFLNKLEKLQKEILSSEGDGYRIPPKTEFHDLIFIKLEDGVGRSLDDNSLKLAIE